MADMERPRRPHGLQPPYNSMQVSTWVFLPTLVLEFLFFVSPILPLEASIPCTIVFCGLAAASAYLGIRAMGTDPADPRLDGAVNSPDADGARTPCDARTWDPNEPTKQCWICDIQVGEKSMHCKFCNKCVDQFDHHCMWLNTCVGKANYSYFFRTMISITAMLIVHATIQLALVIDIHVGNGGSKSRSEDWFQADARVAVEVVMCVFLVFDVVALSLIGQLLRFHIKLRRDGLTTYQFIVRDNKERREQTKLDHELRQKRQVAVAKAREEGRTCESLHLRVGGHFRKTCGWTCCDPLREREEQEEVTAPEAPVSVLNGNGNGNGHAHTAVNGTGESRGHAQEEAKESEDS